MFNSRTIGTALAAGIFTLLPVTPASSQDAVAPEKARALLDQVKKSELDRQIAVKQTEIDRLKEDQAKTERDSASLKQTVDSTSTLIVDSEDSLNKLVADSRRLEHELAVAEARINAERLKIEGLHALTSAQDKSLSALTRHAEEAEARTQLRTLELNLLESGKPIPGDAHDDKPLDELTKARKTLASAEVKTQTEERGAREAMKAAAAKMALAEARAANAKRLADNDLTATMPPDKKAKTAEKSSEKSDSEKKSQTAKSAPTKAPAPIAAPPKPGSVSTTVKSKPLFPGLSR